MRRNYSIFANDKNKTDRKAIFFSTIYIGVIYNKKAAGITNTITDEKVPFSI